MTFKWLSICAALLCATAALAHKGVTNPAVMARMNGMSAIADGVKVLGTMAKGQIAFDQASAREAASAIARHSAESVALFTPEESDPKSEALPAIWQNFDDFTAKARALEVLASDLATSITSLEDVQAGMGPLGASCKSCHSAYRE
ncbi:cytochrome c [uncultured Tateyamaria sp.]|uniref:c-type cytochrome n=1 Tax=uncultured Tateyamaria sp. TaxID=455651 RepID=UPI0026072251|nr:cytochrome c [uncultured Tateyamaria sp.]